MASDDTFGWAINGSSVLDPRLEYMRKNRWVLEIQIPGGDGDTNRSLRLNCSTAARPSISFEETEVHRINGRVYLAGKPTYDPMTVTFYDSIQIGGDNIPTPSEVMENWRIRVYSPEKGDAMGAVTGYKGVAQLKMLAPFTPAPSNRNVETPQYEGKVFQNWNIFGIFPQSINYQDLDYSSSDVQMVEVTFRYDRAYLSQRPASDLDFTDSNNLPTIGSEG